MTSLAGHGGLFLELLEPHIMSDNLTTLNPSVMQAFVEHYRDRRMVDRLELCILHMEMTYLDFHQVHAWVHACADATPWTPCSLPRCHAARLSVSLVRACRW